MTKKNTVPTGPSFGQQTEVLKGNAPPEAHLLHHSYGVVTNLQSFPNGALLGLKVSLTIQTGEKQEEIEFDLPPSGANPPAVSLGDSLLIVYNIPEGRHRVSRWQGNNYICQFWLSDECLFWTRK